MPEPHPDAAASTRVIRAIRPVRERTIPSKLQSPVVRRLGTANIVIISMPELVVLRVVSRMSADRAMEVGADALSYPTTTWLIPNTLGPLDSPVQPWPARLTG